MLPGVTDYPTSSRTRSADLIGRLVASVGTQGRAVTGDLFVAAHFARRIANVRFCDERKAPKSRFGPLGGDFNPAAHFRLFNPRNGCG